MTMALALWWFVRLLTQCFQTKFKKSVKMGSGSVTGLHKYSKEYFIKANLKLIILELKKIHVLSPSPATVRKKLCFNSVKNINSHHIWQHFAPRKINHIIFFYIHRITSIVYNYNRDNRAKASFVIRSMVRVVSRRSRNKDKCW